MAYIGKTPTVGNFQICDAISVVNGQAAYTMQVGGVNVSPESANHMIVSLNGAIQKPTDAYTGSNSVITFASNLVTNDVIDFIQILGNVLDLGVPSDATVSTAKIVDGAVTSAKLASGVGVGKFESQLFHVRDEKSSNTAGGSCSSTSDNQRDLNTILTNEITGASLSSNVITLPAGTFFISASSPTNRGGTNRSHLLNTADNSIQLLGTSENTQTGDTTPTRSFINGRFTISAQKTFRIRHYTTAAKSDNGLGIQANDSRTEVYTDVLIWKVS